MKGSDYRRIAAAIRYLEEHQESQPPLAALSAHLSLSEFHLHRLFKRWAGITPKDFLQVLTLAKARRLLAESKSVLETSLEVGLSGAARLHDLFVLHEAMTPGEYKSGARGVEMFWSRSASPFGEVLIAATHRGVCSLSFDGDVADLAVRWPEANLVECPERIAPIAREVSARMRGERGAALNLVLKGSSFQVKVWEALLAIPEGHVMSYSALAKSIGLPQASRAVGAAVGANPIGYLIPCHRVIRSTGVIGDYHWGSDRKRALLIVEGARARALEELEEEEGNETR